MDGEPVEDLDKARRKTVVKVFIMFIVCALLASVVGTLLVVMVFAMNGGGSMVIGADGGINPAVVEWSTVVTMVLTPLFTLLPVLTRKTRSVTRSNGGLGLGVHGLRSKMGTGTEAGAWARAVGVGVFTAFVIMLVLQVVGGLGNLILSRFGVKTGGTNQTTQAIMDYLRSSLGSGRFYMIALLMLLTGVLGPFVEEVVFRGVIARSLYKSSFLEGRAGRGRNLLTFMASGLLFGVAHLMSTDLSFSWTTVLTVLITWFLGTVLSWFAAERFDSLWPGVFAHVTYNTASLAISLL